jgi:hypothetical protein
MTVTVVTTRAASIDLPMEGVDVGVLNLADQQFDGLSFGAELGARLPWIETVFWYDERCAAPSAAAARSVGVRRVIPLGRLAGWLDDALPSLARMARARREHLRAEQSLPPLPAERVDRESIATPLPEAERRFRETYLRHLLSDSANHTIAARKAGLPYTTFCSMLKKLGIL